LSRLYLNDVARRRDALRAAEEDMPESGMSEDMALQLDVRQALAQLSAEHRAVIVLVGLEQLSYKEAADVLGVPLGTVMSRLARARNQLRSALSAPPSAPDAAPSALLTRIK
jgi:RNA polymerase sigma-70 factor (ECF subfamily)